MLNNSPATSDSATFHWHTTVWGTLWSWTVFFTVFWEIVSIYSNFSNCLFKSTKNSLCNHFRYSHETVELSQVSLRSIKSKLEKKPWSWKAKQGSRRLDGKLFSFLTRSLCCYATNTSRHRTRDAPRVFALEQNKQRTAAAISCSALKDAKTKYCSKMVHRKT